MEFFQVEAAFQGGFGFFAQEYEFQVAHIILEVIGRLADNGVIKTLNELFALITEVGIDQLRDLIGAAAFVMDP